VRIALCVIARDEAEWLPGCLASAAGIADQIIVVDTGSSDRTVELAQAAGAQVIHHPWTEDFSAARNAALPHVEGRWLLVLDADERLVDADAAVVAATHTGSDILLFPVYNAVSVDQTQDDVLHRHRQPVVWVPRMFRLSDGFVFEGVVHESPRSWMTGRPAERVIAPIVHYGYTESLQKARGKRERNRRLLERRVAKRRDDVFGWASLAEEREAAGDLKGAWLAVDTAWRAWLAARPRPPGVYLATLRARLALALGDPQVAIATCVQARSKELHPNFDYLEGKALYLDAMQHPERWARHLPRAKNLFSTCLRAEAPPLGEELPGVRGWASSLELAVIEMLLEHLGSARAALDYALRLAPANVAVQLADVELRVEEGDVLGALRQVEGLMANGPADAWVLAASCCEALGAQGDAEPLVQRAYQEFANRGLMYPHRRFLLAAVREMLGMAGGTVPSESSPVYRTVGSGNRAREE